MRIKLFINIFSVLIKYNKRTYSLKEKFNTNIQSDLDKNGNYDEEISYI